MQQLVGRKGDGWLPSLPWLKPGDLAAGNRVIDEAARAAGRDPRTIHRLLDVTPQYSAAALAERAIEDGVGVFILASDDPAEIRRFAEVTAPEIRERVGEARRRGGSARRRAPSRPSRATRCPPRSRSGRSCRVTTATPATPRGTSAAPGRGWCCARRPSPRSGRPCGSRPATGTSRSGCSAVGTGCPAARSTTAGSSWRSTP
ncbi:hypothetical protein [Pseudonocardia oroxyli]|uniref:hypothetical protein n=1 Tax=Pseudonocardia oroxyli TaxID=366584 RepID=UPI001FE1E1E6|nr:hypothetical protein [Pseudonocardia oroxyli]